MQKHNITKQQFTDLCCITLKDLQDVYEHFQGLDLMVVIKIVDFLHITIDTFTFREKYYPTKKFTF